MCQTFQAAGIACAATNYRLAPSHKWPAQPNDVASAFRWLKGNIGARGGDAGRVFLFGHSSGCSLVSIVAAAARYLEAQGLGPADIAGVIAMGCRLNDEVEVTNAPPSRYEASWVPADRVDDYMKGEAAFVSLEQRNAAVPAVHVSKHLPATLVLIAEAERFFPPILRDDAEFVGRVLAQGADADLVILANRRHMTAIQMMVTTDDPAVVKVIEFVRAH
jgi:acetyl esterase/lipase